MPFISLYALYEPTHGKTQRRRLRTNYITYIQKITGHQLSELIELAQNWEDWGQLVTHSHPTRRKSKGRKICEIKGMWKRHILQ